MAHTRLTKRLIATVASCFVLVGALVPLNGVVAGSPASTTAYVHTGSFTAGSSDSTREFSSENVTLLSWLTAEDMSGTSQKTSDLWGYVSPSGREYAIVGLERGVAFVDVTDPVNPEVVRFHKGADTNARDIKTYREFAYVVNEGNRGLEIFELTSIDKGKVRRHEAFQKLGLKTTHNLYINEDSGFAYLCSSNVLRRGLLILNLKKPDRPKIASRQWAEARVHDIHVVTYENGRYAGREIAFAFDGQDGVHIIDVTDKDSVFTISSLVYPTLGFSHSGWLSEDRRYLYANDEFDEFAFNVSNTTVYIINVRNLERPRLVRSFTNGATSIDHNSMVRGQYLYQANYTSGLRIAKIRRPERPREVAFFDTHPEDDDLGFSGAWGVYAGLPSGNVLVSDIQRGLFVVSPDVK